MIDFPKKFFEPEIRDNFFVDATMKSVWAAALEVLEKISSVCNEYGLEWYAAYGTLLGTIRHEGYIPWDDDMDIWMKRADYQKLLEVLPSKLPVGYHVLSPMTTEGYEQFHTCVVAGEGISIEPKWLKMHHGCPFTVGVDIFPLDYLSRDENRVLYQRKLYQLIRRIDQMIKECRSREQKNISQFTQNTDEILEEIREGLSFLKEKYNVLIDAELFENRQWHLIISKLYQFANKVVMNCEESDADELVEFRDFVHRDKHRFPKEWFQETWAASFENVMLPIPWKYDEVLRTIYGNYEVKIRNSAGHDYPYYTKQLEELRGKMRQWNQLNGNSIPEKISPSSWKKLLYREDGDRKKVILYTNDIATFIEKREQALDKLEKVLNIFYDARRDIILWWRPKESMLQALKLVSEELAERYQNILLAYKQEQWGVCDEENDSTNALTFCDAYYGGQDNLARRVLEMKKPVMIAAE